MYIKSYHNYIMKTNKSALKHYLSASARRRELVIEQDEEIELYMMRRRARMREVIIEEEKCTAKHSKRQREQSSGFLHVIGEDGKPRIGRPYDSLWWINYVLHPELMTARSHMLFRKRFRMPFKTWQDFMNDLREDPHFRTWRRGVTDCAGIPSSPIELLVLGALRYMGRKCTFDCLEELTFVSQRTHERFFQQFITYGGTTLYQIHVIAPQTPAQAEEHMHEMRMAGFDGTCGSMDATNVTIVNCRYGLRISHLGKKLNKTSRTYNIVANHRRRILSTTGGHPSTWNDKTVVLFDDFLMSIKDGDILSDNDFILYERDGDGNVVAVTYKGVWIVVDNGYLTWSTTIPPFKRCALVKELRWSQWLESMRKDVECTFGILKKRWTILDKGVQAKKIENADLVWKTCCANKRWTTTVSIYDFLNHQNCNPKVSFRLHHSIAFQTGEAS
jgi:hypothetical protein